MKTSPPSDFATRKTLYRKMKTLRGLTRSGSFHKGSNVGANGSGNDVKGTSSANNHPPPKKRQSPDEIALTAKNYRLAKELVRIS